MSIMTNQTPAQQTQSWHATAVEELCAQLDADAQAGLTQEDAAKRLRQYGPNELPEAPPASILTLLLSQFTSVIIWVLIGAAVISGWIESCNIFLKEHKLSWAQVNGVGLAIPGPYQRYGVLDRSANLPASFAGWDVHEDYSRALAQAAA